MAKRKIFQILSIALILGSCAPVLFSPDGSSSDNSFLALLGMGGSSDGGTGVSPADAGDGGTTAPVVVVDPLQAEAEALVGFSLTDNTSCYPLYQYGIQNRAGVSACKYKINGVNKVKFYPIYNGMVGNRSSNAEYPGNHISDCEIMPNAQNHNWHNNNAVAEYAINLCYGDYVDPDPEPDPTPAPGLDLDPTPEPEPVNDPIPNVDPEPDPEPVSTPLKFTSWGGDRAPRATAGSAGSLFSGLLPTDSRLIYPESTFFTLGFDRNIDCKSIPDFEAAKKWLQLWKQQYNGNWIQIKDVYPQCWPHTDALFFSFKKPDSVILFATNPRADYGLNELKLEPDSIYRVLLSADIVSVADKTTGKRHKLGVFNTLGDISGQPDQWSGFEFKTTNSPCFNSYADRWNGSETQCNYYANNATGDTTIQMGCAMLTGPAITNTNFKPSDCNKGLFPDVTFHNKIKLGDFGYCDYGIAHNECMNSDKYDECFIKHEKKGACIVNAGKENEHVRIYYKFDSSTPDDCQGIKRPEAIGQNIWFNADEKTHYAKYRRAACDGEPDPQTKPDPEPKPDPTCKNTVSLQTDGGRWYETPASSYVNAKGRTVKIKGIHSFWQNEPLQLNINACATGWYKLAVQAKNHVGPKPDFYGAYHLNITDKNSNREYGLAIRASDERYYSRNTLVYLQKGENTFESLWTNDAYLEGVYDANIQIKSARIVPFDGIPPNLNTTRKAGKNFCQTNGRFFGNGQSIVAEVPDQEAKYCFEGLETGEYKMIVVAKNNGPLPEGFHNFRVRVKMNGNEVGIVDIPAESDKFNRGKIKFNIYGSKTNISLSWINGHAATDEAQARFELKAIRLKKEGAVSQSFLAAYLKSGSMMRIVVILLLSSMVLGMALWMRRRYMTK